MALHTVQTAHVHHHKQAGHLHKKSAIYQIAYYNIESRLELAEQNPTTHTSSILQQKKIKLKIIKCCSATARQSKPVYCNGIQLVRLCHIVAENKIRHQFTRLRNTSRPVFEVIRKK